MSNSERDHKLFRQGYAVGFMPPHGHAKDASGLPPHELRRRPHLGESPYGVSYGVEEYLAANVPLEKWLAEYNTPELRAAMVDATLKSGTDAMPPMLKRKIIMGENKL